MCCLQPTIFKGRLESKPFGLVRNDFDILFGIFEKLRDKRVL
jgi:hypothetical protein